MDLAECDQWIRITHIASSTKVSIVFDQDFFSRPIQVRPVGLEPTTFGFVVRLSDWEVLPTIIPQTLCPVNSFVLRLSDSEVLPVLCVL